MSNTSIENAANHLMSHLKDAGEQIVDFKDDAQKTLSKRVDTLGVLMQEHPLVAVGLGLGVGYLIARLVHR
jgi:ElaB/YqjD/DUF883 family membrane-anchored ribosome-binding protein